MQKPDLALELRDARTARPGYSGPALVCSAGYGWAVLNYSTRHDAFNAFDSCSGAEHAIPVDYWATLPEIEYAPDNEEPDYETTPTEE